MKRDVRRKVAFIAGGVGGFGVACATTAFAMVWVINWYLSNCGVDSRACAAANWLIGYWWSLFVPAILITTVLVYRVYTTDSTAMPAKKT